MSQKEHDLASIQDFSGQKINENYNFAVFSAAYHLSTPTRVPE
jgi:hypothetical protein